MTKGSEQFAWKLYEGTPRVCSLCHRSLRRDDVGQVHTVYIDGKGETGFRCTTCVRAAAPYVLEGVLPELLAVVEAAESYVHFDRRYQRRISTEPIRDALAALDVKLEESR